MDGERDALGRRRSSRSIATGPGSRGGKPIDADYYRRYRRNNPEYVAREKLRLERRRIDAREVKSAAAFTFTEALLHLVRAEAERLGQRKLARHLLIDHSAISRYISGSRRMDAEATDAVIDYFGIYTIVDFWRKERRRRREEAVRLAASGPVRGQTRFPE